VAARLKKGVCPSVAQHPIDLQAAHSEVRIFHQLQNDSTSTKGISTAFVKFLENTQLEVDSLDRNGVQTKLAYAW